MRLSILQRQKTPTKRRSAPSHRSEKSGRSGSVAEITLPMLANCLAAQLLQGRHGEMVAVLVRLDHIGWLRFIKRLSSYPQTVLGKKADLFDN
jgi:hypothetical protein